MPAGLISPFPDPMTDGDVEAYTRVVEREFGIELPPSKRALLEGRLGRRVIECGLGSYAEYLDYIFHSQNAEAEFAVFADAVSTHETSFFREANHFNFVRTTVLAELLKRPNLSSVSALSVACSTGEELYTLGMVLDSRLHMERTDVSLELEGVDLSQACVTSAQRAVYPEGRLRNIPPEYHQRYVMKGKSHQKTNFRIVPELRQCSNFHTGNLLTELCLARSSYDIIFCRNVFIYFGKETRDKVFQRLVGNLRPGGFLFLGHSETYIDTGPWVRSVAHSVYRKVNGRTL